MEDISYFQEQVQALVTEEQKHFDEATQQWVVDQPAVYETVTQDRPQPERKSHDDLLRIIEKRGDTPFLDAMIDKQQETAQWEWYDSYKQYLSNKEAIEFWNTENAGTFNVGTEDEYTVDPKPLPVQPVRPPIITAAQWRLNNYAILRRAAYGSWQEQIELILNDMRNGTANAVARDNEVRTKYGKP